MIEKTGEQGPVESGEAERIVIEGDPTRVEALKAIAVGAIAFGIAAIPSGATAATGTAMTKEVQVDGQTLLASLQRAGLDPKKLDLVQLIGKRADIAELQSRLTGTKSARARANTWNVTFVAYQAK
jgi:hypothetical protein